MATIAQTTLTGRGIRTITETALTASDTFAYIPNAGQILVLRNPTGSNVNTTIDGADGTTVSFPGVPSVDVSAGIVTPCGAGLVRAIPLDTISAFLQGTIAVTGGTGVIAYILNPSA